MKAEQPADLVIIQMGGNDHRHPNEIPGRDYYHAYVDLVEDIHSNWPNAIIILMVCLILFATLIVNFDVYLTNLQ